MRKIKRTITMRKVEISSGKPHEHSQNIEICPLCQAPLAPPQSQYEFSADEIKQLEEDSKENDDKE